MRQIALLLRQFQRGPQRSSGVLANLQSLTIIGGIGGNQFEMLVAQRHVQQIFRGQRQAAAPTGELKAHVANPFIRTVNHFSADQPIGKRKVMTVPCFAARLGKQCV